MLQRINDRVVSFGPASEDALSQLNNCVAVSGHDAVGVLCADHHKGYGMPIGGVIASTDVVCPAMAGYDLACGNYAVETPLLATDIDTTRIMDEIAAVISFGVGRHSNEPIADHAVYDTIAHSPSSFQQSLLSLAKAQLSTVGSGNHYVDLFEDRETGRVWIGVHFGSRGFGHKTATYYLNEAAKLNDAPSSDDMDAVPLCIPLGTSLSTEYLSAMNVAGEYAYAGREWVVNRVLQILGTSALQHVHNHHNFAWWETHLGMSVLVTRKGATPAQPGQMGFVGASMSEDAVIIRGVDTAASQAGLYSAMHGAGRVMGRREAKGVWKKGVCKREGKIDWVTERDRVRALGIELRGAGADEASPCYKRLPDVIAAHGGTIEVVHTLRPIGVAMAGDKEFDPYRD